MPRPLYAAVDLGSNSFHLVLASVEHGQIRVVDRHREQIQLAAGLDEDGALSEATAERALDCLARFGQLLRRMPPGRVRAVGTNTFRVAADADRFRARAERALGHPIEVVSGREEARLIYRGVSAALSGGETRLVVDVGGGSTELIVGRRREPVELASLYVGCVSLSRRFFANGRIDERRLRDAEMAAARELEPVVSRFRRAGWASCLGASGTVLAIADVLRESGFDDGGITLRGLLRLRRELLAAKDVRRLVLPGLAKERSPILPGGLAVLLAVFRHLRPDRMTPAAGALREGILLELAGGPTLRRAIRDRAVAELSGRWTTDAAQAARVERTALRFFDAVSGSFVPASPEARLLLSRAAQLHEVGLAISRSGYHRHGEYVLREADLAGFSREDQRILGVVVRSQRRRLDRTLFPAGGSVPSEDALRIAVLLRLAVLLHRGRAPLRPAPELRFRNGRLRLRFGEGFLARHPLTASDLEAERTVVLREGFRLEFA